MPQSGADLLVCKTKTGYIQPTSSPPYESRGFDLGINLNLRTPPMRAAVFHSGSTTSGNWLSVEDVPTPRPRSGQVLLKVIACGVCRTDLHIVEGDLPAVRPRIIPGHQIVGEVVEGATPELPLGTRAGV